MLQTMLGVFVLFLALLLVKGQMMPSSGGNPSSSALATLLQLQAMSGRPGAGGPPGATLPTPPGAADFGSAAGGGMSPLALAAAGGGGGSSSLGTLGLLSLLGSSQGEGRGNMMQNLMMIQQYGKLFKNHLICIF